MSKATSNTDAAASSSLMVRTRIFRDYQRSALRTPPSMCCLPARSVIGVGRSCRRLTTFYVLRAAQAVQATWCNRDCSNALWCSFRARGRCQLDLGVALGCQHVHPVFRRGLAPCYCGRVQLLHMRLRHRHAPRSRRSGRQPAETPLRRTAPARQRDAAAVSNECGDMQQPVCGLVDLISLVFASL